MEKLAFKWRLLNAQATDLDDSITKRSSHSTNLVNNKIYIFGGEHTPRHPIDNNFLVFDLATSKLIVEKSNSSENEKPVARLGHASCSSGKFIYIHGGRSGVEMNEATLGDLFSFDTESRKWKLLHNESTDPSAPEKRSYHSMTIVDDKIYIFGGCSANHGRLNDIQTFDLRTSQWSRVSNVPEKILPRGGPGFCGYSSASQRFLYIMGGFSGEEQDDCYKVDLATQTFTDVERLPFKLSVFATASLSRPDLHLVVHGGEIDPSQLGHSGAGEFTSQTMVFDGERWTKVVSESGEKPSSRGWHSGCADDQGSRFYIYGGNLESNQRSNELWCLSITRIE